MVSWADKAVFRPGKQAASSQLSLKHQARLSKAARHLLDACLCAHATCVGQAQDPGNLITKANMYALTSPKLHTSTMRSAQLLCKPWNAKL